MVGVGVGVGVCWGWHCDGDGIYKMDAKGASFAGIGGPRVETWIELYSSQLFESLKFEIAFVFTELHTRVSRGFGVCLLFGTASFHLHYIDLIALANMLFQDPSHCCC